MSINSSFSFIIAVVFLFMGVQVRGGKMDFLGKNAQEQIKPEDKAAYCKEMSVPIFVLAVVEAIDGVLQTMVDFSGWSMLMLGAGLVVCFLWIYLIQRKYSR
ncbi:hypothetical protein LQE92_09250 [Lacrimispora sp. NSJ-141]|uniref:DUF3784 domain-containing protein n=2 Tax=Lachnospiraceae TaxID=186803 RepID=A0A7G9G6E6_9FIRM|nr:MULTISPECIES: hypothetical protein [Lachnospiraceae]MCD2492814.1 hypothetical protein [Lientehia hominis]QNM06378.1 DUF3784 domain-containing protein [Qiania dongpingensis]